jgi:hypothetical protein
MLESCESMVGARRHGKAAVVWNEFRRSRRPRCGTQGTSMRAVAREQVVSNGGGWPPGSGGQSRCTGPRAAPSRRGGTEILCRCVIDAMLVRTRPGGSE